MATRLTPEVATVPGVRGKPVIWARVASSTTAAEASKVAPGKLDPASVNGATPSKSKMYEGALLDVLGQMKLWLDDNAEGAGRTIVEF